MADINAGSRKVGDLFLLKLRKMYIPLPLRENWEGNAAPSFRSVHSVCAVPTQKKGVCFYRFVPLTLKMEYAASKNFFIIDEKCLKP